MFMTVTYLRYIYTISLEENSNNIKAIRGETAQINKNRDDA